MVSLKIDTCSLSQAASGNIVGEVFFQVGRSAFPEKHWSDFPVLLLTYWLEALSKLKHLQEREADLCFYDGPYKVRLEAIDGAIKASFINDNDQQAMITTTIDDLSEAMKDAIQLSSSLLAALHEKGWREARGVHALERLTSI